MLTPDINLWQVHSLHKGMANVRSRKIDMCRVSNYIYNENISLIVSVLSVSKDHCCFDLGIR